MRWSASRCLSDAGPGASPDAMGPRLAPLAADGRGRARPGTGGRRRTTTCTRTQAGRGQRDQPPTGGLHELPQPDQGQHSGVPPRAGHEGGHAAQGPAGPHGPPARWRPAAHPLQRGPHRPHEVRHRHRVPRQEDAGRSGLPQRRARRAVAALRERPKLSRAARRHSGGQAHRGRRPASRHARPGAREGNQAPTDSDGPSH